MRVDYEHSQNKHTLEGPQTALPLILAEAKPRSLLDVGCGTGTWLKAALDFGIQDVFGVDGAEITKDKFLVPERLFRQQDLTVPWSLGRRFDVVLCLEVGEHLDEACAATLVDSLVGHSNWVLFSAACPGQPGQHHVNCQWPIYWQKLFNRRGFACSDSVRWKIWDHETIEWWYRQNMFSARKDPQQAGTEPRIASVLHPLMGDQVNLRYAENGDRSLAWYATIPLLGLRSKVRRRLLSRGSRSPSSLQHPAD